MVVKEKATSPAPGIPCPACGRAPYKELAVSQAAAFADWERAQMELRGQSQLIREIQELFSRAESKATRQLSPKQRLGRPLKRPVAGRRFSLGLKVTAAAKTRLDNAARASGRTQSQEAEVRIERSFDRQDLLPEVLSLAYGKRAASLLMRLGPLISDRTLGAEHAES
jgi:hypothetical protein